MWSELYELNLKAFRARRQISAERAQLAAHAQDWIFKMDGSEVRGRVPPFPGNEFRSWMSHQITF